MAAEVRVVDNGDDRKQQEIDDENHVENCEINVTRLLVDRISNAIHVKDDRPDDERAKKITNWKFAKI